MKQLTLTLTLEVTYNLGGESPDVLRANLEDMVDHAMNRGMITGNGPAEVDAWSSRVEDGPAFPAFPPDDEPEGCPPHDGRGYVTLEAFVDQLEDPIDPKDAFRKLCQVMDGEADAPEHDCRLERTDEVAFRSGANDYADAQCKDNQWVTFDNGSTYHDVSDVKAVIAHYDESEYEYATDLRTILERWM